MFSASLRPAWLVLALGLLSSILLWGLTAQIVQTEARDRFRDVTALFVARVDQTMTAYEQVLRGMRAMLLIEPELSRQDFNRFVGTLDLDASYPGIQAVGVTTFVPLADLRSHEQSMRAQGFDGYAVAPAGERSLYTAIVRIAPETDRNRRAIGFDMFSEPTRRAAMELSRDSNTPVLSRRVILKQEKGPDIQPGFLLYLPLYRGAEMPQSVDERRQSIVGFVYAPFRAGKLFDGILSKESSGAGHLFNVSIYDGTATAEDGLLYTTLREADASHSRYTHTRLSEKYSNTWTTVFSSTEAFESSIDYSKAYMAVLAALFGTVMLSGFVAAMALRQQQLALANTQMSLLTRELSHRVKNTLAVVQSIASRSLSDGRTVADARNVFMKRLHALARAHTLLLDMSWRGASLRTLAVQELEPFAARAMITGPDIALNASAAQTFALVLHELATNATKHGAMSAQTGRVAVVWRVDRTAEPPMFHFTWKEAGGPPVVEPRHRGFGRTLLSQHIGHGGDRPTITYDPSGLKYDVAAPLASITELAEDDSVNPIERAADLR